jgi:hypothetical protein
MTTTTPRKRTKKTETSSDITLPNNPFQYEILELVSKQRSNSKKIEYLQQYRNDGLVSILIWNFDESIISLLPEGPVPYSDLKDQGVFSGNLNDVIDKRVQNNDIRKVSFNGVEDDIRTQHTSIRSEYTKFYNFLKGGNNQLSSIRRETMFIQILQGLHPKEAEILCLVKDKKLGEKYKITKEIVSEAYPDITWGGRS